MHAVTRPLAPAFRPAFRPGRRTGLCRLLRAQGTEAREERKALSDLVAGVEDGSVAEVFACGTAAVVTPIGRLAGEGFDVEIPTGPVTEKAYKDLTDIQMGRVEDPFGWTYRIC